MFSIRKGTMLRCLVMVQDQIHPQSQTRWNNIYILLKTHDMYVSSLCVLIIFLLLLVNKYVRLSFILWNRERWHVAQSSLF